MTRFYLLLILQLLLFTTILPAQDTLPVTQKPRTDSVVTPIDSTAQNPDVLPVDSFSRNPDVPDTGWELLETVPLTFQVLERHPYFGFKSSPLSTAKSDVKVFHGKELLFYGLLALLLFFALLRQAFSKYFTDLFRLFFRTTLKQRQIREQLMQTPLPSLLLNGFFFICAGLYITFLLIHFRMIHENDFWLFFLYSSIGLSVIYLVKFVMLKVAGWILGQEEAANSYIFIVFIINKVVGVFLLPILVLLAFLKGGGYQVTLVLSWIGIGGLFLYRFILAYSAIHNQVRFNLFHFFLYLCAFEIAPLLLIYKLLLIIFQ